MQEFYKWDPAFLSVNVQEMDDEHQILINKMNALHSAYKQSLPVEQVKPLVDDFVAYTITHFQDEEAYMQKVGFEGLETHKIIHKQLLEQVTQYVDEFAQSGQLSEKFFNFLTTWLTSHIRGIDVKYGAAKKQKSA